MTDRPTASVRVAAIDCGTNSIRLLIGDVDATTGVITDHVRRMEIVRLGHGVDRTGLIDPAAMTRTLGVCVDYAQQCRDYGVERIKFVATSASRDARNAADFVAGVHEAFGDLDVTPTVIRGSEEARLSFLGATGDLVAAGAQGPYLVVDIGCVRMTERHLKTDPPTAAEIAAATADIDAQIDAGASDVDFSAVRTLVGLAGSVTTITAQVLRLPAYDPQAIHLATAAPSQVQRACAELLAMPRDERAALGYMHPGRVDVIGAGALVWSRVIERVCRDSGLGDDLPVVTSEHDILDGIARSLVDA